MGGYNFTASLEELVAQMTGAKQLEMPEGQTVEELAAENGKSIDWVKDRLRILAAKGLLEIGKKQQMDPIEGKVKTVLSYKIIIPAK